jgi:hypothetical protein
VIGESEKAAKWQMVEDLHKASSHLEALKRKAADLGDRFFGLSQCLKNSPELNMRVSSPRQSIEVTDPVNRRLSAVNVSDLDVDDLLLLIEDLTNTHKERGELIQSLRVAGLRVD